MSVTHRDELPADDGIDLGGRVKHGAGSAVFTLLVIAALGLVLAVSIQFPKSWDFTAQRANSLSQKTEEALAELETPVAIHGLFKDSDRRRAGYWDLLQLYRRRTDKIRVEIFDPNARPGALESLGLAAEDRNAIRDGVSVAVSGGRKVMFRGIGEEDVTNAVLEAGSKSPRVVGFVRGYGERDPNSDANAGMSGARDALQSEYYDVVDVRLDAPIPKAVSVLVAAGPQAAIPKADLDRLGAWLESGGRLLVLADPEFDSGLGVIGERWGLRLNAVKVLDRRSNLRGQLEIPLATDFSKHAIVRGFSAALPLAFPLPAPVLDFDAHDPALFHDYLVKSSVYSEGLTGTGTREQGPFSLAAAAWKAADKSKNGATETRVVLVGDAAFATNGFLTESSNRNFFLNCVGWLSRSRGLVSIRQDPLKGQLVTLRRGDMGILQALVIGPPLCVVLVGLGVYLRRRGL